LKTPKAQVVELWLDVGQAKKNSGKRKKQKGKSSWQEVQDTLKEVNTVTVKSYLLSYAASK